MKKALFLGALSALALPPLNLFPVLLICVPGLLGLIAEAQTRRRVFWLGYAFGFAHQMLGVYWITEAILIRAAEYWWLVPWAVPLLAAILAIFTAVPCLIAWHTAGMSERVLALAGAWVLSNLALQFVATGFPWNLWGSTVELPGVAGNVLIQIGSLIGIHGMTLAVMLLAAMPALSWRWRRVGIGGAVVWVSFGVWRLHIPDPRPPGVTAIVVQGDVPEKEKWNQNDAALIFDHYLQLSREALLQAGPGQKVLIWPEVASPFLLGEDLPARQAIAAVTGPDTPAVIGAVRFKGQTPYNSLFVLDPPPTIAAVYDKWHLVPFGEYQPGWLPGIQLVDGSFGSGRGPATLHVPRLPAFGPLICYEAVFTGQIVVRRDRPEWLINITNDAWFGNSSGPRQHLAAARMRAVEEGLPLVRAANTGISAAFDAKGRELGRIGLDRAGTRAFALPGMLPPTVYAKGGLFIPLILSLVCLLAARLQLGRYPNRR